MPVISGAILNLKMRRHRMQDGGGAGASGIKHIVWNAGKLSGWKMHASFIV